MSIRMRQFHGEKVLRKFFTENENYFFLSESAMEIGYTGMGFAVGLDVELGFSSGVCCRRGEAGDLSGVTDRCRFPSLLLCFLELVLDSEDLVVELGVLMIASMEKSLDAGLFPKGTSALWRAMTKGKLSSWS